MKKRSSGLQTAVSFAAVMAVSVTLEAETFTYYPAGGTAPFYWSETGNWYENSSAYNVLPSVPHGALPTESQDVLINAWGGVSRENPVIVGTGVTATINNLNIAFHNGNDTPRYGTGAALTVDGGTLNVGGNLVFCPGNFTYGTLTLRNGGKLNVSGYAQMGENNYTTAGHCRMDIDATSSFKVSGEWTVGRRARCIANVVTNYGNVSAGSLQIGPAGNAYVGTGVVYNAGSLVISGTLNVGGYGNGGSGGASSNYSQSRGELVLAEGSSLALDESSKIYVGGNNASRSYGDGILDTSIPIVLSNSQTIAIGNAYKSAVNGGVLILRKNARLDNSSTTLDIGAMNNGRAAIRMYDNSSITNVSKIRFGEDIKVDATLEMHGHAVITNVTNMRLSETMGVRTGSKAHIMMDGDSTIFFTCTEEVNDGSGFILGTTADNVADLTLRENARITGLYRLNATTLYSGYGAYIRLEGGRIEFKPQDYSTRDSISFGREANSSDGIGRISGYGVFARTDIASPTSGKYMPMTCRMFDFAFTADGMGEERDLDMRSISSFNGARHDNATGTNGWYAVNKGRLLYPRAGWIVGRYADSPAFMIGDYYKAGTNEYGEVKAPTLVNSISAEPTTGGTGGNAYVYAALYAADRTDYPANVLRGMPGKVASVWRIGTSKSKWNTDEPESPWTDWTAMKLTFRYDRSAVLDGLPLKLYHHDGTPDGVWRRVAKLAALNEGALISATVAPCSGTWNVGWFALVSQEDKGAVIIYR